MTATQPPEPDEKPEVENPEPIPPVFTPIDDPVPDLHDDPPPETVNTSQDDESAQAQTFATASLNHDGSLEGLEDSEKVSSGDPEDDVEDLVDHMHSMLASGRIDMDAYRGERNDDDEDGTLGDAAEE